MKRNESGQGLVEYELIIALMAIVTIAAMMYLGPTIANVFSEIDECLSVVDDEPCESDPNGWPAVRSMMTGYETGSEGDEDWGKAREGFQEFRERYNERYENMGEAFEKANESMWELLEILIEWADTENDALQNALIMAQDSFGDGDYAAAAAIFLEHSEMIGQAPSGVWEQIGAVLMPLKAKTCFHLIEAELTAGDYEAYDELIEAVGLAGVTDIIPLIEENWVRIEQQNALLLEVKGMVCAE